MTAIVGVVSDGVVYLGGDSQATAGWDRHLLAQSKVFRAGPYVFGVAGSPRFRQLLQHAFDPPAPTIDLDKFLATTFVNALRDTMKNGGLAAKNSDVESTNSTFLMGVHGRLFTVHSDYQLCEESTDYAATGSAQGEARGALYATADLGLTPRQRMRVALKAAARHDVTVHGPFTYVSTGSS